MRISLKVEKMEEEKGLEEGGRQGLKYSEFYHQ